MDNQSIKQQKIRGTYYRNQLILSLLNAGAKQSDLARRYGLTKQRIHAIKKQYQKPPGRLKRILDIILETIWALLDMERQR